jgi:hypothetical protein
MSKTVPQEQYDSLLEEYRHTRKRLTAICRLLTDPDTIRSIWDGPPPNIVEYLVSADRYKKVEKATAIAKGFLEP